MDVYTRFSVLCCPV